MLLPIHIFKNWAIPGLFNNILVSSNIKFADDWLRTAYLWCRKRPFFQLSHNHCPSKNIFVEPFVLLRKVEALIVDSNEKDLFGRLSMAVNTIVK